MGMNWDDRYRRGEHQEQASQLLVAAVSDLAPGRALDLACGAGRHAIYLAERGWRVTAVDNSEAALDILRRRALPMEIVRADLESNYVIPPESYDLICDFLYLDRALFRSIREGLVPGGIAVVEVRTSGTWRVDSGELPTHFPGLEILYHAEDAVTAQLIVRRPHTSRDLQSTRPKPARK